MELGLIFVGFSAIAIAMILAWVWRITETTTVYDYEKGLFYKNGVLIKTVDAGRYRYLKSRTHIERVDTRKLPFTISGQEILTKDHVSLRITTVGQFQITDIIKAVRDVASHQAELHTLAQLALRDQVSNLTLEEVLEKKAALDASLFATVAEKAKALGLTILALAVRDVMLPANLKKAFAGSLEAQKEAQRQLEVARGEQAVLRSLANSAKLYENNPTLLQARVIQALSNGNNSIIFGSDDRVVLKEKQKK
jgi:regulator of protease activity HflC (stomatin/prohibitin superfamily)